MRSRDQRRDDGGDACSDLRLGIIEVDPELRSLDPFHDCALDEQRNIPAQISGERVLPTKSVALPVIAPG
jgi:hypothetical protein